VLNNTHIVLGLVLGSGLDLEESLIQDKITLSQEITGVHKKTVFECKIAGKSILVFNGRKHFYEGFDREALTESVRFAHRYGVNNILFTNAAGGLNGNFTEGDLMLITSHINFNERAVLGKKPLTQNSNLNEIIRSSADRTKVKLVEGVYGFYPGPMYETGSEINFQKKLPIDAAGMSTVPEMYEAIRLGMNLGAISVITNLLSETTESVTSHEDVIKTAKAASVKLNLILPELISELN
jgi:purine-nucleoside phosphorylase